MNVIVIGHKVGIYAFSEGYSCFRVLDRIPPHLKAKRGKEKQTS